MNRPTKPKPTDNLPRVIRGGGKSDPAWVRAAVRSANAPTDRYFYLGFRCALRGREPR